MVFQNFRFVVDRVNECLLITFCTAFLRLRVFGIFNHDNVERLKGVVGNFIYKNYLFFSGGISPSVKLLNQCLRT